MTHLGGCSFQGDMGSCQPLQKVSVAMQHIHSVRSFCWHELVTLQYKRRVCKSPHCLLLHSVTLKSHGYAGRLTPPISLRLCLCSKHSPTPGGSCEQ